MGTERQPPNTNVGQKASTDEMENEQQAPNTIIGQKTSLFHSYWEHSIDFFTVLSSLKTNQLHQRVMMIQSVYQLYDSLNTWRKERMKDMTSLHPSTLTLILMISTLTKEEITLMQCLQRAIRNSTKMCLERVSR